MTTLIIHPELKIQKNTALSLASSLLNTTISSDLLAIPPDLHLLDGTLTTSLGIDEVRQLIHQLQYHPYEAPIQIGLIIMANMLTEAAQNSLLKTLEEPTQKTQFILTTPHEKFMLPTILSRAQKQYIAEKISVTTQPSGEISENLPDISSFLEEDLVDRFLYIEELVAQEKEAPGSIVAFLAELVSYYRERLLDSTKSSDVPTAQIWAAAIRQINRTAFFISRNANKRLALENLILQLDPSIMQSRG